MWSLKTEYLRILFLHIYVVLMIWLLPLLLSMLNGKLSDFELMADGRRVFAKVALVPYVLWFAYGLFIAWRVHPVWARRRISTYGKIGWLVIYPTILVLVFSLIARIPAFVSLVEIVMFFCITLIEFPAILTAAYATTAILNAILLSKRRRFLPIYQRL